MKTLEVRGNDLGMVNRVRYYYVACSNCKKSRWTATPDRLCRSCSATQKLAKKRSTDLVYRKINGDIKYYDVCPVCGKELWRFKMYLGKMCSHCTAVNNGRTHRGANNGRWKGGRSINRYGYAEIAISPDDPYFAMARKAKYVVLEHRYVMAKHLGRCLKTWEIVHHKNHIKTDNRIENLELLPKQADHVCIQSLTKRVEELEHQVMLLQNQVGLIQYGNLVLSGDNSSPKCVETIHPISCN